MGAILFLIVWQWNGLLINIGAGFDAGVQDMETFTALSSTICYGKDLVVSPYGPLDWLYKGVCIPLMDWPEAIFKAVMLNTLYALVRVMLIAQFWEKAKSKEQRLIALIASLGLFVFAAPQRGPRLLDLCALLAAVLTLRIHTDLAVEKISARSNRTVYLLAAGIGVLLAVPQLAKFSYFAFAGALMMVLSAIFLFRKRYAGIAVLIGSYGVVTVAGWMLCGEKLSYLVSYFNAMLHFVQGYSEVMAVGFGNYEFALRDFILALLICSFYAMTLFWVFIRNKVQAVSWFIIAPYFFLIFKEAFVRSDHHTASFYQSIVFIAVYLLFLVLRELPVAGAQENKFLRANSCAWGILLILLLLPELAAGGWNAKSMLFSDAKTLISEESYAARKEVFNRTARSTSGYETLLSDVESHPNKTLGMLSGEQSFFLAYGLMDRFQLNPIVSLWENFNSYTESLSTEHYYSENAPEILLYKPEPLDGGYFPFRMGTMLNALLENYHIVKQNNAGYLVMEKKDERIRSAYSLGEPIKYRVGDAIEIPVADDAYVFMKVDWDLTLLGKASSFFLKCPRTYVTLTAADSGDQTYRFYRTLSQNGIYVSNLIDETTKLVELLRGETERDAIQQIRLQGNSLFYQEELTVAFYAVPKTSEQAAFHTAELELAIEFSHEIPKGGYEVYWDADIAFNIGAMKSLDVKAGQKSINVTIIANEKNMFRLDFPEQNNIYSIRSIKCDGRAAEIDSAHDAEVTKTEDGWQVKTGSDDPFIVFHLVE